MSVVVTSQAPQEGTIEPLIKKKHAGGRPRKINKIIKDLSKDQLIQNGPDSFQTENLKKDLTYDQSKYIKLLTSYLVDYKNEIAELADFLDSISTRLHLTRRFEVTTEVADLKARAMSARRFIDNTQSQLGLKK